MGTEVRKLVARGLEHRLHRMEAEIAQVEHELFPEDDSPMCALQHSLAKEVDTLRNEVAKLTATVHVQQEQLLAKANEIKHLKATITRQADAIKNQSRRRR